MKSIQFKRDRFNQVLDYCRQAGVVPQISKLKLSQALKDGVGLYGFDITAESVEVPGDVALNRNDVFIPFSIGVLVSFDNATNPRGKTRLYSYAPRAGAQNEFGFMTADAEAIYNGTLTQQVDQTAIMQTFPLEFMKHIPENEPCILLDGSDSPVSAGMQGEYDIEDMLHLLVPNIVYQGTMDIRTNIQFEATGSSFAVAAADDPDTADTSKAARLTLFMDGVLIKNGAKEEFVNGLTNALRRK